jgi:hypothetical protein
MKARISAPAGRANASLMTDSVNADRRPIQKARGRFPGAGSKIAAMMKICR